MKFSAIIAVSTLTFTSISALPLEMAYRSASSYYEARDVLPSGRPYPRAAAPSPMPEVPEVKPALSQDDGDLPTGAQDPYKRPAKRNERREAIRAKMAAIYEREADPEAAPEPEPEARAEAQPEPEGEGDDDDELESLVKRLIVVEEEAAEKRAEEYIRSFRFHRRAADYASS